MFVYLGWIDKELDIVGTIKTAANIHLYICRLAKGYLSYHSNDL